MAMGSDWWCSRTMIKNHKKGLRRNLNPFLFAQAELNKFILRSQTFLLTLLLDQLQYLLLSALRYLDKIYASLKIVPNMKSCVGHHSIPSLNNISFYFIISSICPAKNFKDCN